jgi:hypothetical protein
LSAKPTSSVIRVADPVDTLRFMFAVGIECSCPVVEGNFRVDQLRETGHYDMGRRSIAPGPTGGNMTGHFSTR